eukprot:COSAG01_NODE_28796_length_652_cov_2.050633_1_plen_176_part_10
MEAPAGVAVEEGIPGVAGETGDANEVLPVQTGGKGKFVAARVILAAAGDLSIGAVMLGARAWNYSEPKKKRKGHEFAVRVDGADASGRKHKFLVDLLTPQDSARWRTALHGAANAQVMPTSHGKLGSIRSTAASVGDKMAQALLPGAEDPHGPGAAARDDAAPSLAPMAMQPEDVR